MKNIVAPKRVPFEDALRNLASHLTGLPAAALPRTQEGIVQFMAENLHTPDEMVEMITQEVLARLPADMSPAGEGKTEDPDKGQQEPQEGDDEAGSTSASPADEPPQEPAQEAAMPAEKLKRGAKNKTSE